VSGRGWRRGTLCSLADMTGLRNGLVCDAGTEGGGMVWDGRRDVLVDGECKLGCDARGRGEGGSVVMSGAIFLEQTSYFGPRRSKARLIESRKAGTQGKVRLVLGLEVRRRW
jgi:hypothetical protein